MKFLQKLLLVVLIDCAVLLMDYMDSAQLNQFRQLQLKQVGAIEFSMMTVGWLFFLAILYLIKILHQSFLKLIKDALNNKKDIEMVEIRSIYPLNFILSKTLLMNLMIEFLKSQEHQLRIEESYWEYWRTSQKYFL